MRKIIEGIFNYIFGRGKALAKEREAICKTCDYYDKNGETDMVVFKGLPACSLCGCNTRLLVHCKSCSCSLEEFNEEPKWKAVK